jgi:hypothetical protein
MGQARGRLASIGWGLTGPRLLLVRSCEGESWGCGMGGHEAGTPWWDPWDGAWQQADAWKGGPHQQLQLFFCWPTVFML